MKYDHPSPGKYLHLLNSDRHFYNRAPLTARRTMNLSRIFHLNPIVCLMSVSRSAKLSIYLPASVCQPIPVCQVFILNLSFVLPNLSVCLSGCLAGWLATCHSVCACIHFPKAAISLPAGKQVCLLRAVASVQQKLSNGNMTGVLMHVHEDSTGMMTSPSVYGIIFPQQLTVTLEKNALLLLIVYRTCADPLN